MSVFKCDPDVGGSGGLFSKIYSSRLDSSRLELQFCAERNLERVNAIFIIWCA